MNLKKTIYKAILIIFSAFLLSSCEDGNLCIKSSEFGDDTIRVDSKTESIFGFYNNSNGGQTQNWQETGYQTNGQPLIIQIEGGWHPWGLKTENECTFCSKRTYKQGNTDVDTTGDNCVCPDGVDPIKEINAPGGTDCSRSEDQQFQEKCTCRKLYPDGTTIPSITTATKSSLGPEINFHHFALDYFNKNEGEKIIKSPCYYKAGMGMFLGFYDNNGVMQSTNLSINPYHLFSQKEVCNVTKTHGKCIDSAGKNIASYLYTIGGEKSTSENTTNPPPNKVIKMTINDTYYSDNEGSYVVTFLQGIMKYKETGLLEKTVAVFEDKLLGKVNSNGIREGGFVKGIYNIIVQDSIFIRILQICLSLYIVFFGMAVIMGVVEVGKKELLQRILKLGLVVFFISPTSWINYELYIVSFFKDGLDSLVNLVMTAYDSRADKSSLSEIAKISREQVLGNSTRFSFVDIVIKGLFSYSVSRKIYGLFYASPIGFIWILGIYSSIFFFIFVMLNAAMFYVVNLIKLVIALALGPIFIVFSLFSKTQDNFKKWLSFLATRAFEILILFLIAYSFTLIIDKQFREMLFFESCLEERTFLWFVTYNVWKSYPDVDGFLTPQLKILTLSYLTLIIITKIPAICSEIISVGGVFEKEKGVSSSGSSAFGMINSALSGVQSIAKSAIRESINLAKAIFDSTFSSKNFFSISNILSYPGQALKGVAKYFDNYANTTNSPVRKYVAKTAALPFRLGSSVLNSPASISRYFNNREKNALIDNKMLKLEKEIELKEESEYKNMDPAAKEKFFREEMAKFAEDNDFINRGFGRYANDMKLINKKLVDKFINKDMQIRAKELSSLGFFGKDLEKQLQEEFSNTTLFDVKGFNDAVDQNSGKVNRNDLKKKGFSDDHIDMYQSYKGFLKENSRISNNKKEVMNYFKGHDVDSLKSEYNKERDRYTLEKQSTLSPYRRFLAYRKYSKNISKLKKDMLKKTIDAKSGEFLKYKKELREYNKLSFLAKELIPSFGIPSFRLGIPSFGLGGQLKRGIKKNISETIEQEYYKNTLLSKVFKYKNVSKYTVYKAFDRFKSYIFTGKALKDLKDELRKEEFHNVMDKFMSDYERRKKENLKNYQDYQNYEKELVDNIYSYVNNNKDNLPKGLQKLLKDFEMGENHNLNKNEKVAVETLLGGSGDKKDNQPKDSQGQSNGFEIGGDNNPNKNEKVGSGLNVEPLLVDSEGKKDNLKASEVGGDGLKGVVEPLLGVPKDSQGQSNGFEIGGDNNPNKNDSKSTTSEAFDSLKSYILTSETLEGLKKEPGNVTNEPMKEGGDDAERGGLKGVVEPLLGVPKDSQGQSNGLEIGSGAKLQINNDVRIKEDFLGAKGVDGGLKGFVDPLLGGASEGNKDNKDKDKDKDIQKQKERAKETNEKLAKFNEAKNNQTKEDENNKP